LTLREANEVDENYIIRCASKNKFENVYLYIDAITYGLKGDFISTYVLEDDSKQVVIIAYEYYGSLQLLEIDQSTDEQIEIIAKFILQKRYKRISGASSLLMRIYQSIRTSYTITDGLLMRFNEEMIKTFHEEAVESFFADETNFHEIAELICGDSSFGKSYDAATLEKQLLNRYQKDGCENLYIKLDGIIVSHFATYALTDDIAVMSGMVTKKSYRGNGLGSILVKKLSKHVAKSGRTPVLYCYESEYKTWYEKMGYVVIGTNSKLEII